MTETNTPELVQKKIPKWLLFVIGSIAAVSLMLVVAILSGDSQAIGNSISTAFVMGIWTVFMIIDLN